MTRASCCGSSTTNAIREILCCQPWSRSATGRCTRDSPPSLSSSAYRRTLSDAAALHLELRGPEVPSALAPPVLMRKSAPHAREDGPIGMGAVALALTCSPPGGDGPGRVRAGWCSPHFSPHIRGDDGPSVIAGQEARLPGGTRTVRRVLGIALSSRQEKADGRYVGFGESACKSRFPAVTLQVRKSAPRARGDGPQWRLSSGRFHSCSPRPRGWSPQHRLRLRLGLLLPAPAGMVHREKPWHTRHRTAPRARGDGPSAAISVAISDVCSPRPRGWSRQPSGAPTCPGLLPAPAGMVPLAYGGAAGFLAAPRARGDGPGFLLAAFAAVRCSPRPRGWSSLRNRGHRETELLPAPAGMVPWSGTPTGHRRTAPRARGDGPSLTRAPQYVSTCSPRPRGWSRGRGRRPLRLELLPAPAGMVPRRGVG